MVGLGFAEKSEPTFSSGFGGVGFGNEVCLALAASCCLASFSFSLPRLNRVCAATGAGLGSFSCSLDSVVVLAVVTGETLKREEERSRFFSGVSFSGLGTIDLRRPEERAGLYLSAIDATGGRAAESLGMVFSSSFMALGLGVSLWRVCRCFLCGEERRAGDAYGFTNDFISSGMSL